MIRRSFLATLLLPVIAIGQARLEFGRAESQPARVLPWKGDWLITGAGGLTAFRGIASPPAFASIGGHGKSTVLDAAIDPSGNLWAVGTTDSDDFRLVNPIVSNKVP